MNLANLLREDHFLAESVAMIGTRRIDADRASEVSYNARYANRAGYTLVTGGAKGTDTIAQEAFGDPYRTALYTAKTAEVVSLTNPDAYNFFEDLASKNHPNWFAVCRKGNYVKNLMVRNAMIVFYSDIVLAWPAEDRKGGTEHGIRVARFLNKPLEIL